MILPTKLGLKYTAEDETAASREAIILEPEKELEVNEIDEPNEFELDLIDDINALFDLHVFNKLDITDEFNEGSILQKLDELELDEFDYFGDINYLEILDDIELDEVELALIGVNNSRIASNENIFGLGSEMDESKKTEVQLDELFDLELRNSEEIGALNDLNTDFYALEYDDDQFY